MSAYATPSNWVLSYSRRPPLRRPIRLAYAFARRAFDRLCPLVGIDVLKVSVEIRADGRRSSQVLEFVLWDTLVSVGRAVKKLNVDNLAFRVVSDSSDIRRANWMHFGSCHAFSLLERLISPVADTDLIFSYIRTRSFPKYRGDWIRALHRIDRLEEFDARRDANGLATDNGFASSQA